MNTLFNNSSPIVLSGQPVTNGAYEFFFQNSWQLFKLLVTNQTSCLQISWLQADWRRSHQLGPVTISQQLTKHFDSDSQHSQQAILMTKNSHELFLAKI